METPNSTTKIWLLVAGTTLGMIVFAGLYFSAPKTAAQAQAAPNFVTNTLVSVVTNEIVKEVQKEVEKIVKVPAEIPQEYIQAAQVVSNFDNADFVKQDQVLFGMKDVKIQYILADDVKRVVSEDEVKSKFELTLRRNNVPLNPKSINTVCVTVDGFFGDAPSTQLILTHSVTVDVSETRTLIRFREMHKASISVWHQSFFGLVGKANANKALLDSVEKQAELFANDFLSANPKP